MFRTIIIAALMSAFAGSAFAMECTQAEMDKLDIQLKAMTDKTAQEEAMKEMKMAGDMMAAKDMPGCLTHLDAVTKRANTKQ